MDAPERLHIRIAGQREIELGAEIEEERRVAVVFILAALFAARHRVGHGADAEGEGRREFHGVEQNDAVIAADNTAPNFGGVLVAEPAGDTALETEREVPLLVKEALIAAADEDIVL